MSLQIESVHVHVDTKNLESAGAGALSCTIFLQIGEIFFPEQGWIDLVSQLIPPWTDQIGNVIEGRIESTECCFMEGPYSFQLSAGERGVLELKLVAPGHSQDAIHTVLPRDIVGGLLAAAEAISREIASQKLATSDSEALSDAIHRLRDLKGMPRLH